MRPVSHFQGRGAILLRGPEAIRHYAEAARLKPDYTEAQNALAMAAG